MIRFQLNTLIEWYQEGKEPRIERVLWIDPANSLVATIDIKDEHAWPIFQKYDDLKDAVADKRAGILEKYEPFSFFSLPDDSFEPEYIKRRDEAWQIISQLIEDQQQQLFNRRERGRLVAQLSKKTGRRKATIFVWLRHYWQRGCTKNALIPGWCFCGQVKEREDHGKKRGRPTKEKDSDGNSTGRNVNEEDQEKFRGGIKDFITSGDTNNLRDAWQLIKERDYTDGSHDLVDGEVAPTILPASEIPTFEQFEYFYRTHRNLNQEIIGKLGRDAFDRNHRPVLGSANAIAFGPGSLYQIDATIGDIYLLSYLDRKLLIGRPVIYIVIDTFSRLIVGFAVTLEGPSWEGATLALKNAFFNKVPFCKEYGVNITEAQWPVEGVCSALLGDNGEIKGYNANSLVNPLDIRVANARPRRPDWKAVVERNFRLLNDIFISWEPGYVHPRRRLKGKDYRFDAVLDLNQFRRLMIKCIRFYNNCYRLKKYRKDEYMIPRKIQPIPIHLWNYGINFLNGKLRSEAPETIRLNLLPKGQASITPYGIRFKGMHYTCDLAMQQQWFTRRKKKETQYVEIVHEHLVDNIYLNLDHGRSHIKCQLTSADSRFKGRDWYEVRAALELENKANKEYETDYQQSLADFHAEINNINAEAREMTAKAWEGHGTSKAAQVKGIKVNRKDLKDHERRQRVASADQDKAQAEPATVIPIQQLEKLPIPKGYIPPARPYNELREARERAKRNEK